MLPPIILNPSRKQKKMFSLKINHFWTSHPSEQPYLHKEWNICDEQVSTDVAAQPQALHSGEAHLRVLVLDSRDYLGLDHHVEGGADGAELQELQHFRDDRLALENRQWVVLKQPVKGLIDP